jgi:integrase
MRHARNNRAGYPSSATSVRAVLRTQGRIPQLSCNAYVFLVGSRDAPSRSSIEEPRSKLNRFVYTEQLIKAALTLIVEAKEFADAAFRRARGIRNGLMVALLALNPTRLKNFAALEIGTTFKLIEGRWWICLAAKNTKSRCRPEERPVATWLNPYIELYLKEARPVLLTGAKKDMNALWISSTTRSPMTSQKIGSLITQITQETLGIAISPHLFRMAGATTAADASSEMPYLASALLGHTDPRITDEHYKRNSSLNVQNDYALIIRTKYLQ